jgi:hypothetical protein
MLLFTQSLRNNHHIQPKARRSDSMKSMKLDDLRATWDGMSLQKSFRTRQPYLTQIIKADPKDVVRLVGETRTRISIEKDLPTRVDDGSTLIFARCWQRGKLFDVVDINVQRTRTRNRLFAINWFEEVGIGLAPESHYVVAGQMLASLGGSTRGGTWNALWGRPADHPLFIPDVENRLPRLREYKAWGMMIPCVWSDRDPRLVPLLRDLSSRSAARREAAAYGLDRIDWDPAKLPRLAQRIAEASPRVLRDMFSRNEDMINDGLWIGTARSLVQKISVQAPQLVSVFAEWLHHTEERMRLAAVRGLLASARADREAITLLLTSLDDPSSAVRQEFLGGIEQVFGYGPCNWCDARPTAKAEVSDPLEVQRQICFETGSRILDWLQGSRNPAEVEKARCSLLQMTRWAPALARKVKKR